ncbi:hypothetical protein CERZMDRAFT_40663 [Cercospora zeae-maydis SCOH1-5]|uniref:Major facilitator superfamily (MFS) profile domain-containing protein n=1 Tax=Cercospora zeae-maydis SCOH1-5 TaxID=717836 RepID=A0A6A6FH68_9PEZI|nr:hypothetical protein CERZMDRAFT_40663 [Cercospora zeae-maydis SCOH1-5]
MAAAREKSSHQRRRQRLPTRMQFGFIMMALMISVFCTSLDRTIVPTAIPRIADDFGSLKDVGLYGSCYLLGICAFQQIWGKLYTVCNLKWVFVIGWGIFEVGVLVAGLAWDSRTLILGRAVAGLGVAGISQGAPLIESSVVEVDDRPMDSRIMGVVAGFGSVLGPILGGIFTDYVSWRWCFYINLPLGIIAVSLVCVFYNAPSPAKALPTDSCKTTLEQFDICGTLVFSLMIVCLLLALQSAGSQLPWGSDKIIELFVIFGVLFLTWMGVQYWKQDYATMPPRLLRQRTIASAAWYGATISGAFNVVLYYLPIWLQGIQELNTTQSGVSNVAVFLSLAITSSLVSIVITMSGCYNLFVIASSITVSIAAGLLSTLTPGTPGSAAWIGYQILFGVGSGLGMRHTPFAIQAVLPASDVRSGTALLTFAEALGGAISISVAQNIFVNGLLQYLAEAISPLRPEFAWGAGVANLVNAFPAESRSKVKLAYNDAITDTLFVATVCAVLSILGSGLLEWKSVKGKKFQVSQA